MTHEIPITAPQPAFLEECQRRFAEAAKGAEALSDKDAKALAKDIADYFERLDKTAPMSTAEKQDLIQRLDAHRGTLLSIGSVLTLGGGLGLWGDWGKNLADGNMNYLLLFAGASVLQADRFFGILSGETAGKAAGKIRGFYQRLLDSEIMPPPFEPSSPAAKTAIASVNGFGQYLVTHREQIMVEGAVAGQVMASAGYAVQAWQGDPYAVSATLGSIMVCFFYAITMGQSYHRNYHEMGLPSPTRLGLPNQKAADWMARNVVGAIPEQARPWLPLGSVVSSFVIAIPLLLQGIHNGDTAQMESVMTILTGIVALNSGYMIPATHKVLGKEDAARFRQAWQELTDSCVEGQHRHYRPLQATETNTRQLTPRDAFAKAEREATEIRKCGAELGKLVESFRFLPRQQRRQLAGETEAKFNALAFELTPGPQR